MALLADDRSGCNYRGFAVRTPIPEREHDMADIFKKAADLAGKVAEKTTDGVKAAGKATADVAGKAAGGTADVSKDIANKTVDAAKATGDAIKGDDD
jgi:hypothetical protein